MRLEPGIKSHEGDRAGKPTGAQGSPTFSAIKAWFSVVPGPVLPQACCVALATSYCLSLLTCKMDWRIHLGNLYGGFHFRDAGSPGDLLCEESVPLSLCCHMQGGEAVGQGSGEHVLSAIVLKAVPVVSYSDICLVRGHDYCVPLSWILRWHGISAPAYGLCACVFACVCFAGVVAFCGFGLALERERSYHSNSYLLLSYYYKPGAWIISVNPHNSPERWVLGSPFYKEKTEPLRDIPWCFLLPRSIS